MMRHPTRFTTASLLGLMVLLIVAAVQAGSQTIFFPNGTLFPNPNGASSTYNTKGDGIDEGGAFFETLGTNGRSCATCHQPGDGMTVSAASVQQRFIATAGLDPIFRTVDGANCPSNDVSTIATRSTAYSLLTSRGLIRIGIGVPATADFVVTDVVNQYGCNSTSNVTTYRRPLPTTNLRFLSAVMWDGRESAGARKITFDNYSEQLIANLLTQSLDATNGHAEGAGLHPTKGQKKQIVAFEMGLSTAQATGTATGSLNANGATGGPEALVAQPFFISINSSVDFIQALFGVPPSNFAEKPGGLVTPGDGRFGQNIFNPFDAWTGSPNAQRAAVARGQTLFNTASLFIDNVAGINDSPSVGGLGVPDATPGTCGTCHDTPNIGNHSFPTPLNIGTGDLKGDNPLATLNKGDLDVSYMPKITACKKDTNGQPSSTCVTTTDLGQALIDGKFDHIGKIKGPILRGLSARAPYFHNGSAQTLLDVVRFYEKRFNLSLLPSEESDLVAFLSSL